MNNNLKLEKSAMAFQLSDGTILWISKEDIHNILLKILAEGMTQKNIVARFIKDSNVTKADKLIAVLANQRDIEPDLKKQYLEEILKLLSTPGEEEDEDLFIEKKV